MAGGFAKDGAVQEQIDASLADEIKRARSLLPQGESLHECDECAGSIPEARRSAMPGVRLCVTCQQAQDLAETSSSAYNRRGSKDSQLR
jgi:phage/conjugal plasmid C-4 type zinc finger TraR family protein